MSSSSSFVLRPAVVEDRPSTTPGPSKRKTLLPPRDPELEYVSAVPFTQAEMLGEGLGGVGAAAIHRSLALSVVQSDDTSRCRLPSHHHKSVRDLSCCWTPLAARRSLVRIALGYPPDGPNPGYSAATTNSTGCWISRSAHDSKSHGKCSLNLGEVAGFRSRAGVSHGAARAPRWQRQFIHRVCVLAWGTPEDFRRLVEDGLEASHRCGVDMCFNPDHIVVEGRSPNERRKNCHKGLSKARFDKARWSKPKEGEPAEITSIRSGNWPTNRPVFTPYAATHHGYSQSRISGTKYLTHRITYQQRFGTLSSSALEVSHLVYLGRLTAYNINPLHMTVESNIINQTRKACALFFENKLLEFDVGLLGTRWWSCDDFDAWATAQNNVCPVIHGLRPCRVLSRHWGVLATLDDL